MIIKTMITTTHFRRLAGVLCALSVLLCSCTHGAAETEDGGRTVSFRITNYVQYSLDEGTRSTPVSSSQVLRHLALGVFDAATDKPMGTLQVQDSGAEGYGSFSVTLPYGQYRLVFLGYGGDRACTMESPERVSFEGGYVPQTFLHTSLLTVNAQTAAQTDITLRRVVAGFRVQMEDAIPGEASSFRCRSSGGGTVLDAKTGLAASATGREYSIDIPESYRGKSGQKVTMYLFLSSSPETMDMEVSALDAQGGEIVSRKFPAVPMRVNTLTVYRGKFFADRSYGFSLMVDDAWGETIENTF